MHRTSWKRWPRATGSSFVLSITFTATWKTEVRTDQNNSSAGNVSSCWSTCTETVRLYYLHLEVLSRASTDVLMSTKNRITLSEIFSLISAPSHPSVVCLFLRTRVTSLKVFFKRNLVTANKWLNLHIRTWTSIPFLQWIHGGPVWPQQSVHDPTSCPGRTALQSSHHDGASAPPWRLADGEVGAAFCHLPVFGCQSFIFSWLGWTYVRLVVVVFELILG